MNPPKKISPRLLPIFVPGFLLASCSTPTEHSHEHSHAHAETMTAASSPPSRALTPEASVATLELPSGYRLEPVLTEPHIAEPVMIAFDGNGRMYVAEM